MNEQPIDPTSEEATEVEDSTTETVDPIEAKLNEYRENLEKQRLNASQKITSMGQENSDLRAQLQQQQAQIDQLRAGSDTQPQTQEYFQQAVNEMAVEMVNLKKDVLNNQQDRASENEIQKLQQQFGVSAEDAKMIREYNAAGDFASAYDIANLNNIRNQRKAEQADQRANAGTPLPQARRANTSSKPQINADEMAAQLEQMAPTERSSAIAKNPDLLDLLTR